MNKCEHCEEKFSYWQVWRSYWRTGTDCPSCGERNVISENRRFFPAVVTIGIPLLVAGQVTRYFDMLPFVAYVAVYLLMAFLFNLLVPLFRLYGE